VVFYISTYFVGLLAGIMNTLAGGGSMLTLPMLMFLGLDANIANATNRIAIFFQNLVAVTSFEKKGVKAFRISLPLGTVAAAGAILGSFIALDLDKNLLQKVIGITLLIMTYFVIRKPKLKKSNSSTNSILRVLVFFGLGIYGGFIQAGIGFLMIAAITFFIGTNLVRTNAIKVGIILIYTTTSLVVFLSKGMVNVPVGLLLALGNMSGAYLAVRFAIKKGEKFLRIVLIVVVIINAVKAFML
jgi:hypothetical protein